MPLVSSFPSSRPSANAWEWTQTALLSVNLAWTTLCLGGYRPETMVVTSALTGTLLAVHLFARTFDAVSRRFRPHPAGWWLLPFLAYAAANVWWVTPVRWLGWQDWYGWAEMIAIFWVVLNGVRSAGPRRVLFATLVAIGLVATVLACYQHFVRPRWLPLGRLQAEQFLTRASGSFGIPNSLAAFLLLLIPATGALAMRAGLARRARLAWGAVCLVLSFGLVLTISRGAWIGLVLALSVWPLLVSNGNWRKRILAGIGTLALVVTLGGALYALSPAIHERWTGFVRDRGEVTRPIMWRGAWRIFREHPFVGGGAGSYNVLFEKFRPEGFRDEPQWAHNDYLNTLSDYGLIGFGLFFGAAGLLVARCARGERDAAEAGVGEDRSVPSAAALGIGLLAFGLQLFVDFHFKIPALAMAFAVLSALIVQCRWSGKESVRAPSAARPGCAILALLALSQTWFFTVPAFSAEALRYGARQRLDQLVGQPVNSPEYRDRLAETRTKLARAVEIDPANAQAWADLAYTAALWGYIFPKEVPTLGMAAETAANRALAIAPVCAEFWIRRGVARDMQGRWFEGSLDFAHATTLSPNSGWVWFYYADHLSRKAAERGSAEAALELCLRIDPQNQEALVLRQHLAIGLKASP